MHPETLGPYRIISILGTGAVGTVYLADGPDGRVALKVFTFPLPSAAALERFEREADALRRMRHRAFPRLYDSGAIESPDGPQQFLAMEYMPGTSLRKHVQEHDPDLRTKLRILVALCRSIDIAHAADIVHRDLKPENIIIDTESCEPRIIDFGIARFMDSAVAAFLTNTGAPIGTMRYLSPEQARAGGTLIDGRTDIYSLALIGYEMLTGRFPYGDEDSSPHELIVATLTERPRDLHDENSSVPPRLSAIFGHALEKDPELRYQTADEFARDIDDFLNGRHTILLGRRLKNRIKRGRRLVEGRLGSFIVFMLVAAIILATGAFLYQTREVNPDAATLRAVEQAQRAHALVHGGPRTIERISTADSLLFEARLTLQVTDLPYTPLIQRSVVERLAEANLILGYLTDRYEYYVASLAYAEEAQTIACQPSTLGRLSTKYPFRSELALMTGHQAIASAGAARAAMGTLDSPRDNLWRGRGRVLWANGIVNGRDENPSWEGENLPPRTSERRSSIIRARILNDLAAVNIAFGAVTDTLFWTDWALKKCLATVDTIDVFRSDRPAYASYRFNYATALRQRAELLGSAAGLDSAGVELEAALEIRTEQFGRGIHGVTLTERSRLNRARSILVDDEREKGHLLELALRDARSGAKLTARTGPVTSSSVALQLALTLADIGTLKHSKSELSEADAILQEALGGLDTLRRSAVPQAELLFGRGYIACRRYELSPAARQAIMAESFLTAAAGLVRREQYPALHKRIESALRDLQ